MNPIGIIFIVLVIIILFYYLIMLFSTKNLLNMTNGQSQTIINYTDLNGGGVSANFAYSIWFYINDWNYRFGDPKVIFTRSATDISSSTSSSISSSSISTIGPCPLVMLGQTENTIQVYLKCTGVTIPSVCNVDNIPIQKWVNLVISVYGKTMDLYIDGKLVRTCLLGGIPDVESVSKSNVVVTPSGGFDGWTSKLEYFANSLNPQEAWNIYSSGYGGDLLSNLKSYQIQFSLLENGQTQSTYTI